MGCFERRFVQVWIGVWASMIAVQLYAAEAETDQSATVSPTAKKGTAEKDTVKKKPATAEKTPLPKGWRLDSTVPRRPGSYIGGGMGYTMANAWYTVTQQDLVESYDIGPSHGYMSFIRVGDALYEWLAAGFQIDILSAALSGADADGATCFGLYVDVTFYPWRGLGLRPSLGVGFSYAQAGKETYEMGIGGPLTLSFAASYEFRVSKGFTMGPMVQVSWVRGEDFDALFFNVGLELIKWFKSAEG